MKLEQNHGNRRLLGSTIGSIPLNEKAYSTSREDFWHLKRWPIVSQFCLFSTSNTDCIVIHHNGVIMSQSQAKLFGYIVKTVMINTF